MTADNTTSTPTEAPSLFERLGGVYAIATVVNDFIDRIMEDPRLNANPKVDEAHHRVSRAGFKYLVTEQVCWAIFADVQSRLWLQVCLTFFLRIKQ